jgi:hypothetical protein
MKHIFLCPPLSIALVCPLVLFRLVHSLPKNGTWCPVGRGRNPLPVLVDK